MLWLDPALARGVLAFLAQHQATETSPFSDSAARQDHARDPQGRDGGAARAAVRPLLWRRRHDAALHLSRRRLCRPHRRHGLHRRAVAVARRGRRLDGGGRAGTTATASSPTSAPPNPACPTRAGRTASIRSSTPTAASRRDRSRWSRCRATSSPPIAGWPSLPTRRGEAERAAHWTACAETMRAAVETHFWMEEAGFYALAIDGDGEPCRVRASNAGHLLYVGLPSPERAQRVDRAAAVRRHSTPAGGCARWPTTRLPFNPMSYHNGSIWPHDTAICAAGPGALRRARQRRAG